MIIDAPARVHGPELTEMVRHAETIIVPVLPSSIDIQAASKFLEDLADVGRVERKEVRIARGRQPHARQHAHRRASWTSISTA